MRRNFVSWLLAQKGREGAIGDVARDAARSDADCCRRFKTAKGFLRHIEQDHRAHGSAIRAAEMAAQEYAELGKE